MRKNFKLVVGSASPRRHKLLRGLGLDFEVMPVDAQEIHDAEDPVGTVVHNALTKHAACRALRPAACILTADTLVWFAGRLIGKPRDLTEAAEYLRAFSGRTQTVYTAVALSLPGRAPDIRVEASSVSFRELDEGTIQAYLERTRPLDRAGAYDIDENGGLLIRAHTGSYANVMGLPVEAVRDWLAARRLLAIPERPSAAHHALSGAYPPYPLPRWVPESALDESGTSGV